MTTSTETRLPGVQVLLAGQMDYRAAWERQRELGRMRSAGTIGDVLMLVEHPHTYTFGSRPKPEQLLVPRALLVAQGIALVESDRGGDITYHGPGQIVGYPILKLSQHGGDVLRYLRMLEQTICVALARYGVAGEQIDGLTGVWVGAAKICAIGVKLSASGVTQHGFALNVSTQLRFFEQIIPCGIADRGVTSLERELGQAPALEEVGQRVIEAFGGVFGVRMG
ncbi:MAG: lipoyl(octanoyl) transferase LipB [Kouleothrix sp.]|jgi:lipoyl(octanoyl) transferase|nr:lipoyl(octanoyl) transferase LipB [Kouleothrix sp.]